MNLFENIKKTLELIESLKEFIDNSINNIEVYELINKHFGKECETKSVSIGYDSYYIIYYNKTTMETKGVFVNKHDKKDEKLCKLVWENVWNKISFIYNIKEMIEDKLKSFINKYVKNEIDKILNINDSYVHFMNGKYYSNNKWVHELTMFFRNEEDKKIANKIIFTFAETKSLSIDYKQTAENPIKLDGNQVTELRELIFKKSFNCDELFL